MNKEEKVKCLECENCGHILEAIVKTDTKCYVCNHKKCLLPVTMLKKDFEDWKWKRRRGFMSNCLNKRGVGL